MTTRLDEERPAEPDLPVRPDRPDRPDQPDEPDQPDGAEADRAPRGRRHLLLQAGAVALGVLVLATGLLAGARSGPDAASVRAERRDAVLIAARSHIETMNSLDHRKVDEGLAAWAAVTSGTLHDQIVAIDHEERTLLADQKKISAGEVVDAAVVDLDTTSATVIASVEITVRDGAKPDAEPSVKRNRFSADMARVDGEWKLENLQQVAVNLR